MESSPASSSSCSFNSCKSSLTTPLTIAPPNTLTLNSHSSGFCESKSLSLSCRNFFSSSSAANDQLLTPDTDRAAGSSNSLSRSTTFDQWNCGTGSKEWRRRLRLAKCKSSWISCEEPVEEYRWEVEDSQHRALKNGIDKETSRVKRGKSFLRHFLTVDRFTSAVGKPGQARETREAVSKALNATNPVRASPISTPMDYEKFVVEKSAQLEHDRDRDLLLFLRDDISESYSQPQERTAVPTVSPAHLKEAQWLLTLDALKHYSSPHSIIAFNYAKFCGDFKKFDAVQGLSYLKFESDMAMDEEKMLSNGQQPTDVIKEAFWW
uniref:Dedicator of cytokinesis C/D N-terminal domain-containing protein n=2 Tax=Ditylenchus dipsaci TaxID=166011 RepID=A0A915CX34_9BILA